MGMRKAALYAPCWKGECEGYAKNFAVRNVWRVSPELDVDDLMQEFYLFYHICAGRYKVDNGAHFMALFKTAIFRRMLRLSAKRQKRRDKIQIVANLDDDRDLEELAGTDDGAIDETELNMLIGDAPDQVFAMISDAEQGKRTRDTGDLILADRFFEGRGL